MRILQSKWFARFARQENIDSKLLLKAITQIKKGLFDADLGGSVFKQRIARPGQGRSAGYRVIILLNQAERAIFIYGFLKSDQDNINQHEIKVFKEMAQYILSLSDKQLDSLVDKQDFIEVKARDKTIPK